MTPLRTLVVLPTYQEADNVALVLEQVRRLVRTADVLVVDDDSPDGTADLAAAVASRLGGIEVLRRPRKLGLGSAYRAGLLWGLDRGYEALVEMDADLSHDPASLPDLLAALETGVDLAIGSRYVPGAEIPDWSWSRRRLSWWGNRYVAAMLHVGVHDATSGFRAYRADALRRIDVGSVRSEGYGFQIEMTHRLAACGGSIVERPICFTNRVRGTSKMSARIIGEALVLVTWWGVRDRLRRLLPTRSTDAAPTSSNANLPLPSPGARRRVP